MTSRENAKDAADGKPNPPSPNDAASKLPPVADTSGYLSEDKKPIQPLSDTQLWGSPAGETASERPWGFSGYLEVLPEPVPTEGCRCPIGRCGLHPMATTCSLRQPSAPEAAAAVVLGTPAPKSTAKEPRNAEFQS